MNTPEQREKWSIFWSKRRWTPKFPQIKESFNTYESRAHHFLCRVAELDFAVSTEELVNALDLEVVERLTATRTAALKEKAKENQGLSNTQRDATSLLTDDILKAINRLERHQQQPMPAITNAQLATIDMVRSNYGLIKEIGGKMVNGELEDPAVRTALPFYTPPSALAPAPWRSLLHDLHDRGLLVRPGPS